MAVLSFAASGPVGAEDVRDLQGGASHELPPMRAREASRSD